MKAFSVYRNEHIDYCDDYEILVRAETEERAIELAKQESPSFRNSENIIAIDLTEGKEETISVYTRDG